MSSARGSEPTVTLPRTQTAARLRVSRPWSQDAQALARRAIDALMKFKCDQCGTRYTIADEKVRRKVLKIRCKVCEHIMVVRDPEADHPLASANTPQPALAAVAAHHDFEFHYRDDAHACRRPPVERDPQTVQVGADVTWRESWVPIHYI